MLNLMKMDFKKIRKDKMPIITLVLFGIFLLLNLLSIILNESSRPSINQYLSQSLPITNNYLLLLPLLTIPIISKDFQYGVIRNKIVAGHSKFKVLMSSVITMTIYMMSIMAVCFLVLGLTASIYKGWDLVIDENTGKNIIMMIILLSSIYFMHSVITVLICYLLKNAALSIIIALFINLGTYIATALANGYIKDGWLYNLLYISPHMQIMDVLYSGFTTKMFVIGLISNIVICTGLTTATAIIFKKSDLK